MRLSSEMEKEMYDLSKPLHVDQVKMLFDDDDDDDDDADPKLHEDLGEESEIDSHDEVEACEIDSETEQDGESDEDEEDIETYYMGRDKKTKWSNKPPMQTKPQNILTHVPAVKGTARNAKTAAECWNSLFTDDILESIVTYTNQYIDIIKDKFICNRIIKPTDEIELRAFFGLLYLAGAYKANRQSLEELWGIDGDGIEKFGLVMCLKRFKILIRCLRFDDRTTRTQRKTYDRLAPIRDLFQKFVENCKKSYCPGENVTIDEMLPGFRGRCAFRQYIPSKPSKYGIKMYALVDVAKTYTYNLEIYAGTQPEGPYRVSNKPSDIVKRMAEPLFGSGRSITADNWFSTCDLIDYLKMQHLSYVGTVRKNKKELPTQFVNVKGRKQYSSMFAFNNGKVLVSYVPREKKNVILVSTLHDDDAIDPGSEAQKTQEIITFYNATKGVVDTADQMCSTFSVSRNTKRWPMVIFFTMLNLGGINSQVIYLENQLEPLRRRAYLKKLAHELVLGELRRRSMKTIGIPSSLQDRLKRFRPEDDSENPPPLPPPKRRRCTTCTMESGHRRLSNYECHKCHNAVCLSHAKMTCNSCSLLCKCVFSGEPLTSNSE
ncbi:piggyBac transposable element-derived protein 4-like [Ranitomeya imitator]|uniref:piggyBac transposable element-derived protein 4-like n=1 Tax=Ranitomeya imitator TaxID=111125 RepID=UPI0037E8AC7A